MLKVERTKDAQCRKEWSRNTVMILRDDEDSDTAELKPKDKKKCKKEQKTVEGQCKCGSTTHLRTSHECPYSKKRLNDAPTPTHKDDDASPPHSHLSDDDMSPADDNSSDEGESTSADDWSYEDIISGDVFLWSPWSSTQKKLSHELKEWSSYRSVQY